MDDQDVIAPQEPAGQEPPLRLETQPDAALRDLIAQAGALLAARQNDRRERALATIRKLARENGLILQAGKGGRKRGRPRKAGAGP